MFFESILPHLKYKCNQIFINVSLNRFLALNVLLEKEPKSPSLVLRTYSFLRRNLYEPKYNSSEFFDFVKNRLADYSSFLTEELNKDLKVHSVALVHPNFCFAKTSLNPDVIFNLEF